MKRWIAPMVLAACSMIGCAFDAPELGELREEVVALPQPSPSASPSASPAAGARAIAAGIFHSLAIDGAGRVLYWGGGALPGDGTAGEDRLTPVTVHGIAPGALAVSTSETHTCAITASGGAVCWGYNQSGQLGDGTGTDRPTPVAVVGLASGVSAIATAPHFSCAVRGGAVYCWGSSPFGNVAPSLPAAAYATPQRVAGLPSGMVDVALGLTHACALSAQGGVWCWGEAGHLGVASTTPATSPVQPTGLTTGVRKLAFGSVSSCVVTQAGALACWGRQFTAPAATGGALGGGRLVYGESRTAVVVSGLTSGVVSAAIGETHLCAVTAAGIAKCLGRADLLGNGAQAGWREAPTVVSTLAPVTSIAANESHSCALTTRGEVWCWGLGFAGQLGAGTTEARPSPARVHGL